MGSKCSTSIEATITNEDQLLAHIAAALAITRDAATQLAALQVVVSTRGAPPGTPLEAKASRQNKDGAKGGCTVKSRPEGAKRGGIRNVKYRSRKGKLKTVVIL